MKKVVIFARVSSTNGTQDYERQINDLQTLASANNWTVEAVFAEKVSGAKKNTERTELMNMINYTELKRNSLILKYLFQNQKIMIFWKMMDQSTN